MKRHNLADVILFAAMSAIIATFVFAFWSHRNIDLPEEIHQAKQGDTLVVEEVKDGIIHLGFSHKKQ